LALQENRVRKERETSGIKRGRGATVPVPLPRSVATHPFSKKKVIMCVEEDVGRIAFLSGRELS
jgi:hypothetical protein